MFEPIHQHAQPLDPVTSDRSSSSPGIGLGLGFDAAQAALSPMGGAGGRRIFPSQPVSGLDVNNGTAASNRATSGDGVVSSISGGSHAVRLSNFDVDSDVLKPAHRAAIAQIRAAYIECGGARPHKWWGAITRLEGSASPEGDSLYNEDLAHDRATSAFRAIEEISGAANDSEAMRDWAGLKPRTAPLQPDAKEEQWPSLRRVDIIADIPACTVTEVDVPAPDPDSIETLRKPSYDRNVVRYTRSPEWNRCDGYWDSVFDEILPKLDYWGTVSTALEGNLLTNAAKGSEAWGLTQKACEANPDSTVPLTDIKCELLLRAAEDKKAQAHAEGRNKYMATEVLKQLRAVEQADDVLDGDDAKAAWAYHLARPEELLLDEILWALEAYESRGGGGAFCAQPLPTIERQDKEVEECDPARPRVGCPAPDEAPASPPNLATGERGAVDEIIIY